MALFKRKPEQPTPEVLDFLADAADLAARQIRREPGRSRSDERTARAVDDQAQGLRNRAAKSRRKS